MTENGWIRVRLGDIAHQISDHEHDPAPSGLKRFVGLEHLDPENITVERWGNIADGTTFTKRFRAGQLLFAKRRAYQRKAAVADFDGLCSSDLIVIEAKPEALLPGLLPYIVHTDRFLDHALRTSSGSLSPRTKWKDLAEYEFDLPPLDRQREVLAILEVVVATVGAAENLVESVKNLGLAGHEEAAALGGPRIRLDEFAKLSRGYSYSGNDYVDDSELGIPFVTINTFRPEGGFESSGLKALANEPGEKFAIRPSDVLLANTDLTPGMAIIGSSFLGSDVLPITGAKSFFSHHVTRVRIDADGLRPGYVFAVLSAPSTRHWLRSRSRGTTVKMLDTKGLPRLEIPEPPDDVQLRIESQTAQVATLRRQAEDRLLSLREIRSLVLERLLHYSTQDDQ